MKYLICAINVFLVVIMLWRFVATNSDKSIIIIIVFYPILLLLNLLIAGILKVLKIEAYRYFISSSVLLLILLIPVLFFAMI